MLHDPNSGLTLARPTHVPVGSQLTVTIGRNIGTRPMYRRTWEDFQDTVVGAIVDLTHPAHSFGPFTGDSTWTDDDGFTVREESAVFTAVTGYPGAVDAIELQLSRIADAYGQDAIAWTYGPNLLARR